MSEIIIVSPEGRLDAYNARALWQELEPLTRQPRARVLVDLRATRYMSSEGLRVLMRASKGVRQNEGRLVLCELNARLTEIVTMAGIDRVLEIFPTRSAGERALNEV